MAVPDALRVWRSLVEASPHGCRVHLTGGEAFGRADGGDGAFDRLLALCRAAKDEGLGPLEAIETNGGWACDVAEVRRRLRALDEAGMQRLDVAADPYHQQFVPIDRPRRLVAVAREELGPQRVKVRWERWLEQGADVAGLPAGERRALLEAWAAEGRERLIGRAASGLDGKSVLKPAEAFDDSPCGERLLRGRHVHVGPQGHLWPATCIGIVAGNALEQPVVEIWRALDGDWAGHPVIGPLATRGPGGLLRAAMASGFAPREGGYATKCQFCYAVRGHLRHVGDGSRWLGPASVYGDVPTGDEDGTSAAGKA